MSIKEELRFEVFYHNISCSRVNNLHADTVKYLIN
jgi:hypothetical protein